jgi:antitoxin HigA-1
MDDERLPNIHPGEILNDEFLVPYGITPYRLSKDIGVPQTRIAEIIAGRRGISADTALRLSRYFGTSAEFWLNLQVVHDLRAAAIRNPESYDNITRSPAVPAAA